MVKIFVLVSLLVILISTPLSVSAQSVTNAPSAVTQRPLNLRAPSAATTTTQPTAEVMQTRGQEVKDAMMEKKQEFMTRIQQIQDTKKQGVVENIVEKLTSANSRITQKMSSALDKLTKILERVEARAEALSATGANTTSLLTLIVEAETAIEEAKAAIATQSEKEYTAEITTDLTLRNTIGAMVSEFRADITAVHEAVIAAKQAVAASIAEAASLQGDTTNDASESANIE